MVQFRFDFQKHFEKKWHIRDDIGWKNKIFWKSNSCVIFYYFLSQNSWLYPRKFALNRFEKSIFLLKHNFLVVFEKKMQKNINGAILFWFLIWFSKTFWKIMTYQRRYRVKKQIIMELFFCSKTLKSIREKLL